MAKTFVFAVSKGQQLSIMFISALLTACHLSVYVTL